MSEDTQGIDDYGDYLKREFHRAKQRQDIVAMLEIERELQKWAEVKVLAISAPKSITLPVPTKKRGKS